jgi:MFS family permease
MHKIRTHHKHEEGKIFSRLILIIGFGIGLSLPIFPNFVKTILNTDSATSVFYSTMAIVMMVTALASTFLLRKVERSTIIKGSLIILSASFFSLIFVTRIQSLAILNALQVIFLLFVVMTLSLYVRDFAKSRDLGKEEGKFFKYQNLGYFAGPLIGGFTAVYFGYETTFILSSLAFMLGFLYFSHLHIVQKHPAIIEKKKEPHFEFFKNLKHYFREKNRCKVFAFTLFLMMWLGFKRLYIPLYIVFSGYIESITGIILALTIIPLILLEEKTGEYADKHGVRKPITLGFTIMALSLLIIFFNPYTFINFFIIVAAHFGMALVEPLQEYFLFKNMKKKDEDNLYGIYMTADPIALFLTPTIGAVILIFFQFNHLFLFFGIIMAIASGFSWLTLRQKLPDELPQE